MFEYTYKPCSRQTGKIEITLLLTTWKVGFGDKYSMSLYWPGMICMINIQIVCVYIFILILWEIQKTIDPLVRVCLGGMFRGSVSHQTCKWVCCGTGHRKKYLHIYIYMRVCVWWLIISVCVYVWIIKATAWNHPGYPGTSLLNALLCKSVSSTGTEKLICLLLLDDTRG